MPRSSLAALLMFAALAPAANAQEPAWLTEARAREAGTMKARRIESGDDWFRATVPARLNGKVELADDSYSFALDVGSESPVQCEVIPGGFDPANLLRAAADITFAEVESIHGRIEQKAVERIDAGVVGHSPLLEIDWIYRANDGSGPRLGAIKQAAAQKGGHGIYCAHIELGYAQTFRNVVRSLVESLQMPDAEGHGEAYFVELETMRANDMNVGVSVIRLVRDEDGDTQATTQSSMLLPAGEGTVQAQDSYTTEWLRPDGSLINAAHVEIRNGGIESNLGLTEQDDGRWWVEGEHMGKTLEQAIAADAPASLVQQAWLRRELLDAEDPVGRQLSGKVWLSADPTRFSDWHAKVTGAVGAGEYAAQETVAGLVFDTVLEPSTGLPLRFSMPLGPMTLTAQRAAVHGRF